MPVLGLVGDCERFNGLGRTLEREKEGTHIERGGGNSRESGNDFHEKNGTGPSLSVLRTPREERKTPCKGLREKKKDADKRKIFFQENREPAAGKWVVRPPDSY